MILDKFLIERAIKEALIEDLSPGDLTTDATIPEPWERHAYILAKEDFILAGSLCFKTTFELLDSSLSIKFNALDGDWIKKGTRLAELKGNVASILKGERVALNFLQRLSGIATLTRQFVDEVAGLNVRICDTRKTTPGLRILEKYAVRVGGGFNHRFSLADGILIKDNHIAACGGVRLAVERARLHSPHGYKIEVEVSTKEDLLEAIEAGADAVLLDNMTIDELKSAVELARQMVPDLLLEASGGVNLENVRAIAETGIDIISVGALTHSARSVDISLKVTTNVG